VKRRKGRCRYCKRPIALTRRRFLWAHGTQPDGCPGTGSRPIDEPARYWPAYHYGRRVVTIPGPDTWNTKETAA